MRWSDEELAELIADFESGKSVSVSQKSILDLALDLRDLRRAAGYPEAHPHVYGKESW